MAKVVRIGAHDKITNNDMPTNVFWRFLEQVRTVVTSFSDLDGTTNDISEGDVNRFREIADLVITRDIDGRITKTEQNGKTATVTRDISNKIEVIQEIVDAEPTKITTQTISRDLNTRIDAIDYDVQGYEVN